MGEKTIKSALPEWTFLAGNFHEGDSLAGRTILLHFPSFTILEVMPANNSGENILSSPTFQFHITDAFGDSKTLQFYIHCTLSHDLDQVLQDSAIWYSNYLKREERNVLIKEKSKQN